MGVCTLLLLAVTLVFGQTIRHEFLNYDDNEYVYENVQVTGGLTGTGIVAAFTRSRAHNWHPLTWLSHMLDWQLYGRWAGGHHLTNVLLHAATAMLLFLVLRRMTGGLWPSAFVAAVFAVHPLHVESVAWVAERKDTLSGLFFTLTLGAYVYYVARPSSWARFAAFVAFYALGLMSKPMLVTLPFVLLLLDYWPLGRMRAAEEEESRVSKGWRRGRFLLFARLVLEKIPLLALAVASCIVTVWAQQEAIAPNEYFSLPWRIGNAVVSYVAYLGEVFYPAGLAVYYPHPGPNLLMWQTAAALSVLMGITAVAVALWRRSAYLLVGWLWYLGMLVPVIGVVQVGLQARADRYTYLTQIGVYMALAWAMADLCRSGRHRRWLCSVGAGLALVALMGCAWRQTSLWHDSETLWRHTLACTLKNPLAHNNLGNALAGRGEVDEAMAQFRKALEIKADYAEAYTNLGNALARRGEVGAAIAQYRKALDIEPDFAEAHNNLGAALAGRGEVDAAIAQYRKALEIKPDYAEAHTNLGNAFGGRGEVDAAIAQYRLALELQPDYAAVRYNLGNALAGRGEVDAAIAQYRQALEIQPDYAEAHNNLGAALANRGQVDAAIAQYRQALEIKPDNAEAHNNLGAALANRGQVDAAIVHYQAAIRINPRLVAASLNLGTTLMEQGRPHEAVAQWRESLRSTPDAPAILNALARALATGSKASLRNGTEAVQRAERAVKLTDGKVPELLDTLAAAYAEAGAFSLAIETAQKALALAGQQQNAALVEALQRRIKLYRTGSPFHEAAPPPSVRSGLP